MPTIKLCILHQINQVQVGLPGNLKSTRMYRAASLQFINSILAILNSLHSLPSFYDTLFPLIEANLIGCGDRAAMGFNEIYLAWHIANLEFAHATEHQQVVLLARAAKTVLLHRELQKKISVYQRTHQLAAPLAESVEIYLYYEIALRERLHLLTINTQMLYSEIGRCHWINCDELVYIIQSQYLDEMIAMDPVIQLYLADSERKSRWDEVISPLKDQLINVIDITDETLRIQTTSDIQAQIQTARKQLLHPWLHSHLRSRLEINSTV